MSKEVKWRKYATPADIAEFETASAAKDVKGYTKVVVRCYERYVRAEGTDKQKKARSKAKDKFVKEWRRANGIKKKRALTQKQKEKKKEKQLWEEKIRAIEGYYKKKGISLSDFSRKKSWTPEKAHKELRKFAKEKKKLAKAMSQVLS